MKIAVIGIRGIPASYSGFETSAENTSKIWAKEGHSVLLYCRKHWYKNRLSDYKGVRLKYKSSINTKSLDTLSHTMNTIIDLILFEKGYKQVHLYNIGNGIWIPLLRIFGKKVIVSADGIEWKREKWGLLGKIMYKVGEFFAVKFADIIISDNEEVQKYYMKNYSRKTELIKYGTNLIEPQTESSSNTLKEFSLKSKEYYIFIGRLVPEKGVHHLIEQYEKLKTEFPLVIIGDAPDSSYTSKLKSRKSNKIHFLGYLFNEKYEDLLANAYMYVSASKLEGTSPSLLTALGSKTCALVQGIAENRNTAMNNAWFFYENDYDDLLKKWQTLNDSPKEVQLMAEKGYKHVKNNYSWSSMAEEYLNIFRN